MSPEQVEKWEAESGLAQAYIDDEYVGPPIRYLAEFARLVHNAAIKEATQICRAGMDGTSEKYSEACYTCAELINDLHIAAAKEPRP